MGLLLVGGFIFLGLYWLTLVGVAFVMLGVAPGAPKRTKVRVVGDEVLLYPQHVYASVYPCFTVCFGLIFVGTAVQMVVSDIVDIRILIACIGSAGLVAWFAFLSFMGRGPVRVSSTQVRLPGREPIPWADARLRYDAPGRYAGTIIVERKSATAGGRSRMRDFLRFGATSYNLDFNSLASALMQIKNCDYFGQSLSPAEIRAMLLTPAPDPLPAVGKSVEVPIDVSR